MTLDACIAHAIDLDLDIMEALPSINSLPLELVEHAACEYVWNLQERLSKAVTEWGGRSLRNRDPAGLCRAVMRAQLGVPLPMLLDMCQTIVILYDLNARFLGEREDGRAVYEVRMKIDLAPARTLSHGMIDKPVQNA